MLSKEEVSDVLSYCQEHGCTYKDRLFKATEEWIKERKMKQKSE